MDVVPTRDKKLQRLTGSWRSRNVGLPERVVMMQGPREESGQQRQQQASLQCLGRMEDDLS